MSKHCAGAKARVSPLAMIKDFNGLPKEDLRLSTGFIMPVMVEPHPKTGTHLGTGIALQLAIENFVVLESQIKALQQRQQE